MASDFRLLRYELELPQQIAAELLRDRHMAPRRSINVSRGKIQDI